MFLKRSRNVRLVSPIYCFFFFFFHVFHSIIYVKLGELQVKGYFFRLFSPVLVIVYDVLPWLMYGQVRQP